MTDQQYYHKKWGDWSFKWDACKLAGLQLSVLSSINNLLTCLTISGTWILFLLCFFVVEIIIISTLWKPNPKNLSVYSLWAGSLVWVQGKCCSPEFLLLASILTPRKLRNSKINSPHTGSHTPLNSRTSVSACKPVYIWGCKPIAYLFRYSGAVLFNNLPTSIKATSFPGSLLLSSGRREPWEQGCNKRSYITFHF